MFNLRRLFSRKKPQQMGGNEKNTPDQRLVGITDSRNEEIPRYPPFAKGIPAISPEQIMGTQGELIEKIRRTLGLPVTEFNEKVMPVLTRYAEFVHLLPASQEHHHRGAGGLFRHGLEVAYWSARLSESIVFNHEGDLKDKRINENKWRLATCLAGLLHDVGKASSDMNITDESGLLMWSPYGKPIHEWAEENGIDRYFISWRDNRHKRHERYSLQEIGHILTDEVRDYLATPSRDPYEALLDAVAGAASNETVPKMVLVADQESVKRDLKEHQINVDDLSLGVPVERFLIDSMRRLINTKKWKVNEVGGNVWTFKEGTFVVWKDLKQIYSLAKKDGMPGIPRDADTLADILIERGFAIPNIINHENGETYYRYWEVAPEIVTEKLPSAKLLTLRLENNDLIFTSGAPSPITGVVVDENSPSFAFSEKGEPKIIAENDDKEGHATTEESESVVMTTLSDQKDSVSVAETEPEEAENSKSVVMTTLSDQKDSVSESDPETKEEKGNAETAEDALAALGISTSFDDLATPSVTDTAKDVKEAEEIELEEIELSESPGETEKVTEAQSLAKKETNNTSSNNNEAEETREKKPQKDAPTSKPLKPSSTTSKERLLSRLDNLGEAGAILSAAILPVLDGTQSLGEIIAIESAKVIILTPNGTKQLAKDPREVGIKLKQANLITTNAATPSILTQNVNGIEGLVINDILAISITKAIEEAEEQGLVKKSATKSPVKKAKDKKPKRAKRENGNSPAQTGVYGGGKAKREEQSPSDKVAPRLSSAIPVGKIEPETQSTDQSNKNDSDEEFETKISAREALSDLSAMIIKGEGRWLKHPVIEQDGYIKTSIECLTQITKTDPHLKEGQLRASLLAGVYSGARMAIQNGYIVIKQQ